MKAPADFALAGRELAVESSRLQTVHYDSPDLRLLRWGVSLRFRAGDGWIVKLPASKHTHGAFPCEHTFPGASGTVPAGALDLVAAMLRGVRPGPMAPLQAAGKPPPEHELVVPKVGRNARAADLVQAALATSVLRLVHSDPALRVEPTAKRIHAARVSVRRLRSQLQSFRPVLHGMWADRVRDRLRWLSDTLSGARDADVLLADITARAHASPAGASGDIDALLAPFIERRDKAYAALGNALRSLQYLNLIDALIAAARAPQLMPHAYGPARPLLDELMQPAWRRLRKRVRAAGAIPHDRDLHRIRIKAKHVRYAAEALAPVAGDGARKFAKRAEHLQMLLGEQHDAVVASGALHAEREVPQRSFLAGEIAASEDATAQSRRNRWHASWKRLSKKTRRFW